ncbi:unnamed protein product [Protopolystoma xenopodis]|uniref:Uncharacterized protein n=1 Tax=Protopolystoma xenopodis TaxID=117903 RepID=A0A448XF01_9PLAT|nr:unnamed protein product [Protopolystoma xenopodis]
MGKEAKYQLTEMKSCLVKSAESLVAGTKRLALLQAGNATSTRLLTPMHLYTIRVCLDLLARQLRPWRQEAMQAVQENT